MQTRSGRIYNNNTTLKCRYETICTYKEYILDLVELIDALSIHKHCPDFRKHIDRLKYVMGGYFILSQWERFLDEYDKYEFHEPYLKQVRKTIQSKFFKLETLTITKIRNVCLEEKMTLNWWHDRVDNLRLGCIQFKNLNDVFFSVTLENNNEKFQRILQKLNKIDSNLWIQTNQSSTSPPTQHIIVYLKKKIQKITNQSELDHFKKKIKKCYNFILIGDQEDDQKDDQKDDQEEDIWESDSVEIDEEEEEDVGEEEEYQNNETYRNRFYQTWKNDIIYKPAEKP